MTPVRSMQQRGMALRCLRRARLQLRVRHQPGPRRAPGNTGSFFDDLSGAGRAVAIDAAHTLRLGVGVSAQQPLQRLAAKGAHAGCFTGSQPNTATTWLP